MKEKNLIIGVTAIIVIVIIITVVFNISGDKEEEAANNTTPTTVATTTVAGANEDGTNFWDNVDVFEGDGDSVVIDANEPEVETDKNGEAVTDEAGENATKKSEDASINVVEEGDSDETISEEYPGQAAGWSPIVSPDDLKN